MPIDTILALIVKYGIPLAEQIYNTVSKHGAPTPEMWTELKALNAMWTVERYEAEAKEKGTPVP
jgi:hypothetical protein